MIGREGWRERVMGGKGGRERVILKEGGREVERVIDRERGRER